MVLIAIIAASWIASEFAHKMYVAYRLDVQVQQLQRENQALADANSGYQQQLNAMIQPGGSEDTLRQHNYVKRDEQVYAIIAPSPSPSPASTPSPAGAHAATTSDPTFWDFVWHTVTAPFRK
jgi:cell division protein FtsB